MGFNHSALIGFGGAGSAGLPDSVFPQGRSSSAVAFTSAASNVAVSYPTLAADDILFILTRVTDNVGLTSAVATGFTEINRSGGGGGTSAVVLLWKRATGAESGTVSVTISGGSGSTQSVWAVMWSVKNCVTSGTPYAGNDTDNGGGPPASDFVGNPFTTTAANNGGMHVAFVNNTTITVLFQGMYATGQSVIQENIIASADHNNSLAVNFYRCDAIGTYANYTITGATDAVAGGGKTFFSMELSRKP